MSTADPQAPTLASLASLTAPPTPPPPPPPAPPTGLDMSEQTAQFVLRLFACTVCTVFTLIAAVLAYRVAVDGNEPRTIAITDALVSVFPWLAAALVAAVVGVRAVPTLAQALAKTL